MYGSTWCRFRRDTWITPPGQGGCVFRSWAIDHRPQTTDAGSLRPSSVGRPSLCTCPTICPDSALDTGASREHWAPARHTTSRLESGGPKQPHRQASLGNTLSISAHKQEPRKALQDADLRRYTQIRIESSIHQRLSAFICVPFAFRQVHGRNWLLLKRRGNNFLGIHSL